MRIANIAKNKVKKKGKKYLKKGVVKIIGLIGIPGLLFFAFFIFVIAGAAGNLNEQTLALGSSENNNTTQEIPEEKGKATYIGVDDSDTEISKKIMNYINRYSNSHNPYFNGYMNYCERFCRHTYENAGIYYGRNCCATNHRNKKAKKSGKLPKGALIFSGLKPNGTVYQNGGNASLRCSSCGNYSGHVAIYIGDGKVAGSQLPYIMSLDKWIEFYGYGGWSFE